MFAVPGACALVNRRRRRQYLTTMPSSLLMTVGIKEGWALTTVPAGKESGTEYWQRAGERHRATSGGGEESWSHGCFGQHPSRGPDQLMERSARSWPGQAGEARTPGVEGWKRRPGHQSGTGNPLAPPGQGGHSLIWERPPAELPSSHQATARAASPRLPTPSTRISSHPILPQEAEAAGPVPPCSAPEALWGHWPRGLKRPAPRRPGTLHAREDASVPAQLVCLRIPQAGPQSHQPARALLGTAGDSTGPHVSKPDLSLSTQPSCTARPAGRAPAAQPRRHGRALPGNGGAASRRPAPPATRGWPGLRDLGAAGGRDPSYISNPRHLHPTPQIAQLDRVREAVHSRGRARIVSQLSHASAASRITHGQA